ncbi:saccharopine dehydrogenase NADP-binding domain-containing protein [bacterium]|nr:saccharopine dehydrogenase NADP-binding domain-containing protein [bacterium]
MNNVLILGAGMVTRPMVDYLLARDNISIVLADVDQARADALISGHVRGSSALLDVNDNDALGALIKKADLVVSLVPYTYHPIVAKICIAEKKNMVTASYVSPAMKDMDQSAKDAGVLILNEIGLDPGIDHMSAMRIIHDVERRGGKISSFYSYCGGLPAPEANTNPLGYKFSWSPKGVVLAGRNSAKYLREGQTVDIASEDLFTHTWDLDFDTIGTLSAYPNRDSMPYREIYGLKGIYSLYRGTLRYPGWCETWKALVDLGYLNLEERHDLVGRSYASLTAELAGVVHDINLQDSVAKLLGVTDKAIMERMKWLGLFSDEPLPDQQTVIDVISARLLEKMQYDKGERDMVVLHHDFEATFPNGKIEQITSTLIEYGIPDGDSAMARTVSLPAAIAVRLILEGKINEVGVRIPVDREIYEPVLNELESMGVVFTEKVVD